MCSFGHYTFPLTIVLIQLDHLFLIDTRMENPITPTSSTSVPASFSSAITSSLYSAVVRPTPIVTQGKQAL